MSYGLPTAVAPSTAAASAAAWIDGVVALYGQARRQSEQLLACAASCQLSAPQFWILWAVQEGSRAGVCQLSLAQQTGLSAAHVSGVVEQLRQAGLIAGARDPADRRRQLWSLTAIGQQRLSAMVTAVADWLETPAAVDSLPRDAMTQRPVKPREAA